MTARSGEERVDAAASAITPSSRRTIWSTTERCSSSGSRADGLRVLEPARVEHGLRGEHAELLGEEAVTPTGTSA